MKIEIPKLCVVAMMGASGSGNLSFMAIATDATETGTITVTPFAGCYGAPATFTITVNPRPVITVNENPTGKTLTCAQPSITLTASGGDSYAWNNGMGNNAGAGALLHIRCINYHKLVCFQPLFRDII